MIAPQAVTFRLPAGIDAVVAPPPEAGAEKPPTCCRSFCSEEKADCAADRFPACREFASWLKSCASELLCWLEVELAEPSV